VAVFKFRNLKSGQATPIPPGEFTVGRADDVYVHLEDPSVSRRHAQVINNDAGFFIEDLGSANGTATRGSYITRRMNINYGDLVHIGSVAFRVDPEIEGEVDVAPSAGMRTPNRAYMRRDTERLPNPGESQRVVEKISAEKLSAPAISESNDMDADDLNAVTMSEPGNGHEPVTQVAQAEPSPSSAREIPSLHLPLPVPTPQRQPQIHQPDKAVSIQADLRQSPAPTASAPVQASTVNRSWSWFLLVFLAGMGVGLLLGLCFARLFIEMGGKAASLP